MGDLLKLKSIAEEAEDCRAAFSGVPPGALAWHCHHEILLERLAGFAEARIHYILTDKPSAEKALRLRLFRPFQGDPSDGGKLTRLYACYKEAEQKCFEYRERGDLDGLAKACTERDKAYEEYKEAAEERDNKAHLEQCPNCPWNGKTIFPGVAR